MKNRDLLSSLFWLGFGALFAGGGLHLGLVRQGIPGPGSMPFIVGLVMIALGTLLLVQALLQKEERGEKFFPEERTWQRLVLVLVGLVGYGLLLKKIGFVLVTFLFLTFVLRFVGSQRWSLALVFSLLTAGASFLLFSALQVDLPRGLLDFSWRG